MKNINFDHTIIYFSAPVFRIDTSKTVGKRNYSTFLNTFPDYYLLLFGRCLQLTILRAYASSFQDLLPDRVPPLLISNSLQYYSIYSFLEILWLNSPPFLCFAHYFLVSPLIYATMLRTTDRPEKCSQSGTSFIQHCTIQQRLDFKLCGWRCVRVWLENHNLKRHQELGRHAAKWWQRRKSIWLSFSHPLHTHMHDTGEWAYRNAAQRKAG